MFGMCSNSVFMLLDISKNVGINTILFVGCDMKKVLRSISSFVLIAFFSVTRLSLFLIFTIFLRKKILFLAFGLLTIENQYTNNANFLWARYSSAVIHVK